MSAAEKVAEVLEHCEALDAKRKPWESFWNELAEVVHPRRKLINQNHAAKDAAPQSDGDQKANGRAMRALRTLATGQSARITPMGGRWFGMRPDEGANAGQAGVSYFHHSSEIVAQQLRKSNFYTVCAEHYLDRGAFGTAATEIRAGKNLKGLHFESYPVGTYSISEDENGEVDTICRSVWMTPLQLRGAYGIDKLPESVVKKLSDAREKTVPLEIKRMIRPRFDRDPRRIDKGNKAWESFHILFAEKHLLAEDGYDEFPVAVSRWERWGDTPYGWPPAYMALDDATKSSFIDLMLDTLAETAAFPRVLYPSNIKGDVSFKALGLTCYDPTNGGKPEEWLTQGRYDIGIARLEAKERAIDEAFYVPLFNGISQLGSDATAEQVRALVSESRELFHPILASLTREFLTPVIRRAFALCLAQGKIEYPPDELLVQGDLGTFMEDPGIEFTSPMALALEQSQIANFNDVMSVMAPHAANDPTVMDFVNWEEIGRAFYRYKGLPENFIKPPEAIAALQQARADAAAQQAQAQQAESIGKLGGAEGIQKLQGLAQTA